MAKLENGICKYCGVDVVIIHGESRRYICNPRIINIITEEGKMVTGRESHFSTCLDAKPWQKRKRNHEGKHDHARNERG